MTELATRVCQTVTELGPADARSIACLINRRSGGRRGEYAARSLAKRKRVMAVVDIGDCAPDQFVEQHAAPGRILLACGGDGTASALLDSMYRLNAPGAGAVVPLGTGNDLARALGWRPGRTLKKCVKSVRRGRPVTIDRWRLQGPGVDIAWFNYCSLGSDARIALRFERMRQHHRWLFRSALTNKIIYGLLGGSEANLPFSLRIDGVPVPKWTRALVWTNIPSYGGGGDLGKGVSIDDGLAHAFALGPGLLFGLGTHGPRYPRRLGAQTAWDFDVQHPMVLQTDGEAVRINAGRYRLWNEGQVTAMHYRRKPKKRQAEHRDAKSRDAKNQEKA